jgi:hypothetical protein
MPVQELGVSMLGAGRRRSRGEVAELAGWGVVELLVRLSVVVPEGTAARLAILDGRADQSWRDLCALRAVSREARRVVVGVLRGSPFASLLVPGAALEAGPRTGATAGGSCGWAWLFDLYHVSYGPAYYYGMITAGCHRGGPLTLRSAIWFARSWITVVALRGDLVVGTANGDVDIGDLSIELIRHGCVALVLERRHWSVRRLTAAQLGRRTFPTYRQLSWAGWGSRRSGSAR